TAVLASAAVAENQQVSCARKPRRDPVRVMLQEEFLVLGRAGAVGPGIPPTVQDVSALAVSAALVTSGLGPGRTMIDNPDLVKLPRGKHDLVEAGVIGYGVDVGPVGKISVESPHAAGSPAAAGSDVANSLEPIQVIAFRFLTIIGGLFRFVFLGG